MLGRHPSHGHRARLNQSVSSYGDPVAPSLPLTINGTARVTTAEANAPHPLQQAFIDEQAGQCGYCLPGILIPAKALLDRKRAPSRSGITAALDKHLCRCGPPAFDIDCIRKDPVHDAGGGENP